MQEFKPLGYLAIDIANNFGLDKKTWNERLDWFDEHQQFFDEATLSDLRAFAKDAKEPAQFVAGVLAYQDVLLGLPIGHMCSLDGTASGLQILSVLSGCKQSAQACNVITEGDRDDRKDAYEVVYEEMQRRLGTDNPICPKQLKKAVMTHMYGSKQQPILAFGEDTPELEMFYKVLDDMLPGANKLNKELLSLWNPQTHAHAWTLPDGLDAVVKVIDKVEHEVTFLGETYIVPEKVNRPMESGLSLGANITHSIDGMIVREMGRRSTYDVSVVLEAFCMLTNRINADEKKVKPSSQKDLQILRAEQIWETTRFCSLVGIEYLDRHNVNLISKEYAKALLGVIHELPDEPFHLLAVHD